MRKRHESGAYAIDVLCTWSKVQLDWQSVVFDHSRAAALENSQAQQESIAPGTMRCSGAVETVAG